MEAATFLPEECLLILHLKCMEVAIFNSFKLTIQIASRTSVLECDKRTQPKCAGSWGKNIKQLSSTPSARIWKTNASEMSGGNRNRTLLMPLPKYHPASPLVLILSMLSNTFYKFLHAQLLIVEWTTIKIKHANLATLLECWICFSSKYRIQVGLHIPLKGPEVQGLWLHKQWLCKTPLLKTQTCFICQH